MSFDVEDFHPKYSTDNNTEAWITSYSNAELDLVANPEGEQIPLYVDLEEESGYFPEEFDEEYVQQLADEYLENISVEPDTTEWRNGVSKILDRDIELGISGTIVIDNPNSQYPNM